MVVPDILTTTRLVVLASGYSVAAVRVAHRDGDLADKVVDSMSVLDRQVIQVLVVLVGHDQHVATVVWPPSGGYQRGRERILANDVPSRVGLGLGAFEKGAERALVTRGLMVEHSATLNREAISARGGGVRDLWWKAAQPSRDLMLRSRCWMPGASRPPDDSQL